MVAGASGGYPMNMNNYQYAMMNNQQVNKIKKI